MVGGFAPIRGPDSQDEPLKERPFLVRHQVSCQAGLHRRYQLEARSAHAVNPFCQHDLGGIFNIPNQIVALALQSLIEIGPHVAIGPKLSFTRSPVAATQLLRNGLS